MENIKEKKKKIKEKLSEPKTRIIFVLSLIIITIASILTLFKIDPDRHSIVIYEK
jgi:hypothetical protein